MKITDSKSQAINSVIKTEKSTSSSSTSETHQNEKVNRRNTSSGHKQLISLAKQFGIYTASATIGNTNDIYERARKREQLQKLRKQQNLENIMLIALGFASEEHPNLKVDPDWFNQFQGLAEDASHGAMQKLWAKILVGEIANPGSFSLKTLTVFKNLNVNEANIFSTACHLAVKDRTKASMRIITGYYLKPSLFASFNRHKSARIGLGEHDLQYSDVLTLSNLGLLFSDEIESQALRKNHQLNFTYNGLPLTLITTRNDCVLNFYKFTQVGMELAKLINDEPNLAFYDTVKSKFSHHFLINSH